jgi:phytanoyl-CoA hydroxylase
MNRNDVERFRNEGYIVVRALCPTAEVHAIRQLAIQEHDRRTPPLELEADLGYPGAPLSISAPGGNTIRRLLNAVDRSPVFAGWMCGPVMAAHIEPLIGEPAAMSRAHHNCIMTKHPHHGSQTGWHRDSRYWSFARPTLVSAWLALGVETPENGSLRLVPGSHRLEISDDRFDAKKFLRLERPDNRQLVDRAVHIVLDPGDVLFFHCETLHSASGNSTDAIKWSLVSTYHGLSNQPTPGTRSSQVQSMSL